MKIYIFTNLIYLLINSNLKQRIMKLMMNLLLKNIRVFKNNESQNEKKTIKIKNFIKFNNIKNKNKYLLFVICFF